MKVETEQKKEKEEDTEQKKKETEEQLSKPCCWVEAAIAEGRHRWRSLELRKVGQASGRRYEREMQGRD